MKVLVILGAGGHGREVLDVVQAVNDNSPTYDFLGFLDDGHPDADLLAERHATVLGKLELLPHMNAQYVVAIGSPARRREVATRADEFGAEPATLVHPAASLGSRVTVGPGSMIAAGARLTTNVVLGQHVHINVNATVSHDCVLGHYATLSPGVHLSGRSVIGDDVLLGTGAVVIPGIAVGKGAVVGAGAVVVRDVPAGVTVVGVPAEPIEG